MTTLMRLPAVLAAVVIAGPCALPAWADSGSARTIVSISVCSPDGRGGPSASCPGAGLDTQQAVLAAGSPSLTINESGVKAATDEHSTVFPPGYLRGNGEYMFFVASGLVGVNSAIGMMALSSAGPDNSGQWTLKLASGYGDYASGPGGVFLPPIVPTQCPDKGGDATLQDQTFDLGYAAPGTLFKDPSSDSDRLLMIYEGTNACAGSAGGSTRSRLGSYETIGVATSIDGGRSWPRYASTPDFAASALPQSSPAPGQNALGQNIAWPNAPFGAMGSAVCLGNLCPANVPQTYGRYQVLSPPLALNTLVSAAQALSGNVGNAEPSAFVDGNRADDDGSTLVYVISEYVPGQSSPAQYQLPNGRKKDLILARAELNRDGSPLKFLKWNGIAFADTGRGGLGAPLLPAVGGFTECGDPVRQERAQGSISFVEETRQYLLVFVCTSPGDPSAGQPGGAGSAGSAWFYSTSDDLSNPSKWSVPKEIEGSWAVWNNNGLGCPVFNGWYPTFMSLNMQPGHLSTRGHVFYMAGSLGACTDPNTPAPKRQYSSRQFTIVTGRR
jgi:hypothetical protein